MSDTIRTEAHEPKWESLCESCGGSCPEIQRLPDGGVLLRDVDEGLAEPIRLTAENLKALFGKWIAWT